MAIAHPEPMAQVSLKKNAGLKVCVGGGGTLQTLILSSLVSEF